MINRKQEWQIPPINAQEVPTQTPQIPGQVQDIAGRVAGNLRRDLAQPQQAYSQFVANRTGPTANVQPDFNTQSAVEAINSLWNRTPGGPNNFTIGDVLNSPGAVNTRGAYDASLVEANRQFSRFLLPQLQESFGRRGLRYSSSIADAAANAYGDIQSRLGSEAARAGISAAENAAGRQQQALLSVLGIAPQRAQLLSNVGAANTGLQERNRAFDYSEFLRRQPDVYYQAAQNFLGTRPLYPQMITSGGSVLQQQPSQVDKANEYLKTVNAIAGAIPAVQSIFKLFT